MTGVAQPVTELKFTRADYDRLPEDLRVELIHGELLKMPSPTVNHQAVARRLFVAFLKTLDQERLLFGPVDFVIDDYNVLVPDVVVLERPPVEGQRVLEEALLVAEVLSPSTARRDRTVKTGLYLGAGVREVWLIDANAQAIEVRTADAERTCAEVVAFGGAEIAVQDLFRAS